MSRFRNKKIKYPDEFVEGMDRYVEKLPMDEDKKERLSQFLHKSSGRLLDIETAGNLVSSWLKENVPEKNDIIREQTLDAVREARELSKKIREKRIISNTKKFYSYDEGKGNVSQALSMIGFSHELIEYADAFSKKEYFGSIRERYKDDLKQTPATIIRSFSKSEGILRGHLEMARTVKTLKKAGRAVIYDPLLPLLSMGNDRFKDQFLLNLHSFIREGGHLDLIIETDCSIGPFGQLKFFMPLILSDDVKIFFHSGVKNHDKVPFFVDMDKIFGYGLYSENNTDSGRGNIVLKKMLLSKVEAHYEDILKNSTAVGRTYLPDRRLEFIEFLKKNDIFSDDMTRYKTALPLFTMHEKMLRGILTQNGVADENAEFILRYRKLQKKLIEKASGKHSINIFMPSFENDPEDKLYQLDLAGILYPTPIYYSKEDFLKHLRWTVDFTDENPNFQLHIASHQTFTNIEAILIGDSTLIITKPRDPAAHLVITFT